MSQRLRNFGEHSGPQTGQCLMRCKGSQIFATADSKRLSRLQVLRQHLQPICVVTSKSEHQKMMCPLTRGCIVGLPSSGVNMAPESWRSMFTGIKDMTRLGCEHQMATTELWLRVFEFESSVTPPRRLRTHYQGTLSPGHEERQFMSSDSGLVGVLSRTPYKR